MLSWFRTHAKSSWAKALYYFIALTFFGGFGVLSSSRMRSCAGFGGVSPTDPVAHVNGRPIAYHSFQQEVQDAKRRWLELMREQYGSDIPEDLTQGVDFKSQVMDQKVEQIVLMDKAREWEIKVSDAEVRDAILKERAFRDRSGRFNQDIYISRLAQFGETETSYEAAVRDRIAIAKLMEIVGESALLVEGEAREIYQFENEKLNIEYLAFDIDERYGSEEPTEEEIAEYYEANKSDFDLPETRKLKFLKFHVPDYEKKVKLSKGEFKEYYEQTRERYMIEPEKAELSHILVGLSGGESNEKVEEARKRALEIASMAREGRDFAELAREYSDDTGTRDAGGYLGEASSGTLMPSLQEVVFKMEPGGISDPVRTNYGFHVLRLESKKEASYMTLEEVREEVEENLVRSRAFATATLDSSTAERMVNEGKSLEEISKELDVPVYTSEFFYKQETGVPDIPDFYQVSGMAFLLEKGQISERMSGLDDIYIIEVTDISEPHQAGLEESMEKIKRLIAPDIRRKRALAEAVSWLDELKEGADKKSIARKAGLKWEETGLFPRAVGEVPGLGYSEDLEAAVFRLDRDRKWPDEVFVVEGKAAIICLKDIEPADMEEFEEDPLAFEQQILDDKREEILRNFIESLKKDAVVYTPLYDRVY